MEHLPQRAIVVNHSDYFIVQDDLAGDPTMADVVNESADDYVIVDEDRAVNPAMADVVNESADDYVIVDEDRAVNPAMAEKEEKVVKVKGALLCMDYAAVENEEALKVKGEVTVDKIAVHDGDGEKEEITAVDEPVKVDQDLEAVQPDSLTATKVAVVNDGKKEEIVVNKEEPVKLNPDLEAAPPHSLTPARGAVVEEIAVYKEEPVKLNPDLEAAPPHSLTPAKAAAINDGKKGEIAVYKEEPVKLNPDLEAAPPVQAEESLKVDDEAKVAGVLSVLPASAAREEIKHSAKGLAIALLPPAHLGKRIIPGPAIPATAATSKKKFLAPNIITCRVRNCDRFCEPTNRECIRAFVFHALKQHGKKSSVCRFETCLAIFEEKDEAEGILHGIERDHGIPIMVSEFLEELDKDLAACVG